MVFREDVIYKKLDQLDKVVTTLRKISLVLSREAFFQETEEQWKVERGLQLACQSVLDIGDHLLTSHFEERVDEYEQVIEALRKHSLISAGLAHRLRGIGGFRNIIVHEYGALDYEILYDHLKNHLIDIEDYIKEILAYLNTRSTSPGGQHHGGSGYS